MNIDKRNRTELKAYFVKNAIPTESNFADQIDAMLNQKDDGIAKLPGDPLSIEASADTPQKKVINFYESFADARPAWVVSLNPCTELGSPNTAKAGFDISDGEGSPRFFIDRRSGRIGLGTLTPAAKLHIEGEGGEDTLILGPTSQSNLRLGFDPAHSWIQSHGNKPLAINPVGNDVGLGTRSPTNKLDVQQDARSGAHASGRALYVTGSFGSGSGVEFRHSNGTQGIGFGYNTIYATGRNGDQDLNLNARGQGTTQIPNGLRIDGNRNTHIQTDGAFYRYDGQVYITVDDNLYIRDTSGGVPFRFQTDSGQFVGAARNETTNQSVRIVTGKTPKGSTPWVQYGADGIYVDVKTGTTFQSEPQYFTSLGGNGNHWTTQGGTSIYSPNTTGFRIYVHQPGVTIAGANSMGWHICWIAMGV